MPTQFQKFDIVWTNYGFHSFYPAIVSPRADYGSFLTYRGIILCINHFDSIINIYMFSAGTWYIRLRMFLPKKPMVYADVKQCFPFCGKNDLAYKLRQVQTSDIIKNPQYVLSLVIPSDKLEFWLNTVQQASTYRNIHADYRYSMLKFQRVSSMNFKKKYSYVSMKICKICS